MPALSKRDVPLKVASDGIGVAEHAVPGVDDIPEYRSHPLDKYIGLERPPAHVGKLGGQCMHSCELSASPFGPSLELESPYDFASRRTPTTVTPNAPEGAAKRSRVSVQFGAAGMRSASAYCDGALAAAVSHSRCRCGRASPVLLQGARLLPCARACI